MTKAAVLETAPSPGAISITRTASATYVFQVDIDYKIDDRWHLNADFKKVFVNTDINVNKGVVVVDDADVDPWIFGLGVGYRF